MRRLQRGSRAQRSLDLHGISESEAAEVGVVFVERAGMSGRDADEEAAAVAAEERRTQ